MLETVISCGTCYVNRFFVPTRYEKQLVKIRQYIGDRNKSVLIPSGICITDPMERGLRVVSPLPRTDQNINCGFVLAWNQLAIHGTTNSCRDTILEAISHWRSLKVYISRRFIFVALTRVWLWRCQAQTRQYLSRFMPSRIFPTYRLPRRLIKNTVFRCLFWLPVLPES